MATTYLTDGPLSSRKSGKTVSRVNTDRSRQRRNDGGGKRNRGGNGQLSAEDMISLFQSMPVPNRGYKNPNAAQPAKMGGGLDWMDKNNSPDRVAQRQNQTDWAQGQGRDRARLSANSAVAEAKALQAMPKGPPTSAYGTGSARQLAPGETARGTMPHPITGEQVFMDEYLAGQEQVQNTKYGPGRDEFGGMKVRPSAAQAGLDYFNPQKMTMPTPVKSRPAPKMTASLQPSNSGNPSGLSLGGANPNQDFSMPSWVNDALIPKAPTNSRAASAPNTPQLPTPTPPQSPSQAPPLDISGFEQQMQDHYPQVHNSNPFIGAPYGGAISPEQQAVIDMFAPPDIYQKQADAGMPYAQRPLYAAARQNSTGPIDLITQYPFLSDKGVSDMSQFWPDYDWSTSGSASQNMKKFQQNFNDLVEKGLLDYQPTGDPRSAAVDGPRAPGARSLFKPRIVPQSAEERLLQNLFQ